MTIFPIYWLHWPLLKQNLASSAFSILLLLSNVCFLLPLFRSVNFQKPVTYHSSLPLAMQCQRSGGRIYPKSRQLCSDRASSNSAGGVENANKGFKCHQFVMTIILTLAFTPRNKRSTLLTDCNQNLTTSCAHEFLSETLLFYSLYLNLSSLITCQ